MSPTGTDKQRAARRGTAALVASVGALALMPFAVQGAGSAGLAPGEALPKGAEIPESVTNALKARTPVVVAFVLPGINDDILVRDRLIALRKEPGFQDTKILIFNMTAASKVGELPGILGITETPAAAVFRSDDKLFATWRGIVDEDMIAQSITDARAAVPTALKLNPPTGAPKGSEAGIALARKVNAHYAKAKGVTVKYSTYLKRPNDQLTGIVTGEQQVVLAKGKVQRIYEKGIAADGVPTEAVLNRTGVFLKRETQSCWLHSTPELGGIIDQKVIPIPGTTFGKPKKAKDGKLVMTVLRAGEEAEDTVAVRIDPKTYELVSFRDSVTTDSSFATEATAPKVPKPEPIC